MAGLWFLVSAGAGRPLAFLYSRPLLERRTRTLGVADPGPDRPDTWDAGGPPGGLAAEEYVALTTYRRDDTPVTTPVWAAPDGGRLYVYTHPNCVAPVAP